MRRQRFWVLVFWGITSRGLVCYYWRFGHPLAHCCCLKTSGDYCEEINHIFSPFGGGGGGEAFAKFLWKANVSFNMWASLSRFPGVRFYFHVEQPASPWKEFRGVFMVGGTGISLKFKFSKSWTKMSGSLRVDSLRLMTNLATNVTTVPFFFTMVIVVT